MRFSQPLEDIIVVERSGLNTLLTPEVLEKARRRLASGESLEAVTTELAKEELDLFDLKALGGPGSGNFGHAGRPGEIGGSAPASASMTRLSEKYPDIAARFEEPGSMGTGTIGAHTAQVSKNWNRQISKAELADISERWGSDVDRLMEDAVALHDIGKGEAIKLGLKENQHIFTEPILRDVLSREGYSERDVELAVSVVGQDLLGEAARYGGGQHRQAAQNIKDSAHRVGMDVADYAKLQLAFFHSDAGAYPWIRGSMFRNPLGALSLKKGWRLSSVEKLTQFLLKAAALFRSLGGPGSGNFGHAGRPGEVGGSAPNLSSEERHEVVRLYTQSGGTYREVNEGLRNGKDMSDHQTVQVLDDLFKDETEPVDRELFRGLAGYDPYELNLDKGSEFTDLGFTSTTTSRASANRFATHGASDKGKLDGEAVGIVFKINAKGSRALNLAKYSRYGEDERLLNRGTKFRVTGVKIGEPGKSVSVVSLTVVP